MSETFTFEKIYRAYLDCRKTKRKTINALKFEYNLERNLFALQKELETKKYKPGRSICFAVTKPCPREIFAASFRDRVVHHVLVREVEQMWERTFIFDSFACRKNKGTHSAIGRLEGFMRRVVAPPCYSGLDPESRNVANTLDSRLRGNDSGQAFYLQLDISGFFMAINQKILYLLFEKSVLRQNKPQQWKNDILWLAKIIIFNKPTENYIIKGNPLLFNLIPPRKSLFNSVAGKGLPIGNHSSQFLANLYLNELDQFIKRELKCKKYIRYVDDFILMAESKEKLKEFKNKINIFLKNNLDLELNLNKTKLQQADKGIDFLGYFIKPNYMLARKKVVSRFKNILYNIEMADSKKTLATINSYFGHFNHAFTFNLRKHIYKNCLGGGGLKGKFLASPNYKKLILKS